MTSITSKTIQREYGRVRSMARAEPITITHHGRDDLVLVSAEEFQRLKRRDREVLLVEDLSNDDLKMLLEADPPPEADAFNHEMDDYYPNG